MEPAKRDALLADIAQVIDSHGGRFDVDYETHLYISLAALIAIEAHRKRQAHDLAVEFGSLDLSIAAASLDEHGGRDPILRSARAGASLLAV
jgi:hypothetical protein